MPNVCESEVQTRLSLKCEVRVLLSIRQKAPKVLSFVNCSSLENSAATISGRRRRESTRQSLAARAIQYMRVEPCRHLA